MITIDTTKRAVREVHAPFSAVQDGENIEAQVRVQFYDLTIKEMREAEARQVADKNSDDARRAKEYAKAIADGKTDEEAEKIAVEKYPVKQQWLSESLMSRLAGLPDFINPDGSPFVLSVENLEALGIKNLRAIENAINEELRPK